MALFCLTLLSKGGGQAERLSLATPGSFSEQLTLLPALENEAFPALSWEAGADPPVSPRLGRGPLLLPFAEQKYSLALLKGGDGLPANCPSCPFQDLQSLRYLDSLRSSFQFFLPLNSGGSLHLPASAFLAPSKEKRLSLDAAVQKQLVCRWSKVSRVSFQNHLCQAGYLCSPPVTPGPALPPQCNQLFDLLQDLVDHVNDFHVKPEKDAGYRCHWEGCARHGRGFNAR